MELILKTWILIIATFEMVSTENVLHGCLTNNCLNECYLDCSSKYIGILKNDSFVANIKKFNFQNVIELRISNTALTDLEIGAFTPIPQLRTLNMSSNSIQTFDYRIFLNLTKLEHLNLSKNKLLYLRDYRIFQSQYNLRILLLGFNLLTTLPGELFYYLRKLNFLDLSYNRLVALPDTLFRSQQSLHILLLGGNKLQVFHENVLQPLAFTIRELALYENPFVCNCNLRTVMVWCSERGLVTNATCQVSSSSPTLEWLELRYFENCDLIQNVTSVYAIQNVTNAYVTTVETETTTSALSTEMNTPVMSNNSSVVIIVCVCLAIVFIVIISVGMVFWKRHKRCKEQIKNRNNKNLRLNNDFPLNNTVVTRQVHSYVQVMPDTQSVPKVTPLPQQLSAEYIQYDDVGNDYVYSSESNLYCYADLPAYANQGNVPNGHSRSSYSYGYVTPNN